MVFRPTPLKNDGVKVSWDDDIPNIWKVIIQSCSSHHQPLIRIHSRKIHALTMFDLGLKLFYHQRWCLHMWYNTIIQGNWEPVPSFLKLGMIIIQELWNNYIFLAWGNLVDFIVDLHVVDFPFSWQASGFIQSGHVRVMQRANWMHWQRTVNLGIQCQLQTSFILIYLNIYPPSIYI